MTRVSFWIDDNPDDPIAMLGLTDDVLKSFPYAALFDDLMLRLYEGNEFWYLSAQDAYGILGNTTDGQTVSLFDHERVLLTCPVGNLWLQQARASGGFGLIVAHDISLEEIQPLTRAELVAARNEGQLELILVDVNPPTDLD